ncbi:hypothetical protein D3C86_1947490 [compost metagenome]
MRAVDDVLSGLGARQDCKALVVVFLAQFGHGERAGGTLDEAHAQALFQQGDAAAEARFGDVQGPSGRRKTAVLDDLDEVIKVIQVVHAYSS